MPKDTKKAAKPEKVKKANPALEDDEVLEDEETDADEAEETETETEATDEADADEEVEEEVEEKPKPKAKKPLIETDAPKARQSNDIERQMKKDALSVEALLSKQAKVRMFIPLGIGEKKGSKGAYESVTINGFRMVFPKGEYVTVPESVAAILEEHYNMTPENTAAGEAFRLDRPRVQDGMSTEDALG